MEGRVGVHRLAVQSFDLEGMTKQVRERGDARDKAAGLEMGGGDGAGNNRARWRSMAEIINHGGDHRRLRVKPGLEGAGEQRGFRRQT